MSYIGQSMRRLEDPPLLTGQAKFAADISFPGQLHMRVVRSQVACGRLLGVDAEEALSMEGVVGVWVGRDVAEIPPIDFRQSRVAGLEPYRQPIIAQEYVRYVGEPVAVVFANDSYLAEDAAGSVFVDVEELDVCIRATDEPKEFGPGLSTEAAIIRKEYGDLQGAFRSAHRVVELELRVGRHTGVPLETRGCIARYDRSRDLLELHGAAKVPHYNRDAIAEMLGRPRDSVQLFEGHVGGGFGVRGELYPEDVITCLAALRLGRPIKWIEDRREHFLATNHSRDQTHRIRAAVDNRGFVLGLDDEFWVDQGAYVRTHAATVPDLTAAFLPGPYVVPAFRAIGHIRLTNKTPAGTYRAPGRYEGTFVRERLLDEIAHQLDLGRVDVRRVNLITPNRMPYPRGLDSLGTEVVYDSGDYPAVLERILDHVDYERLQESLQRRREAGERVGVGIGCFVEKTGLGPYEKARVTVGMDGAVEVVTGAASLGQGIESMVAQVCADALGVSPERIRVVHGQTDAIDFGMGAFASRVTVMTGSATHVASGVVRNEALKVAAGMLEVSVEDLVMSDGVIWVRGSPAGPSVTLAAVARKVASDVPEGPGLSYEGRFEADHMVYAFGAHLAVVVVDGDTGGVEVERFVVAYDVGRAVNPMLVEGQLVGGAAQGIGGALFEGFVYDEWGQPLVSSFMDYLMPTVSEIPMVESIIVEDTPTPLNPLGVRGAGEGGINAVGAAVAAAVDDALGMPGAIRDLPVTPAFIRSLTANPVLQR
jgi:CO/xanthine dehydrogenase Mo-binding subunit